MRRLVPLAFFFLISPLHGQDSKKQPQPSGPAVEKATQLILEVIHPDLVKAQTPDAKGRIAQNLLRQARLCNDDSPLRFALYTQAATWAAQGGDLAQALAAVEGLAQDFDISPSKALLPTFQILSQVKLADDVMPVFFDHVLTGVQQAIDLDQYKTAQELLIVAHRISEDKPALRETVAKKIKELETIQSSYLKIKAHLDQLEKAPEDPAAHLQVGRYYALIKGRWDLGLKHLAKSGDGDFQKWAQLDLAAPKDVRSELTLADGWWELAQKENEPGQTSLLKRAAHWYQKSLGKTQGLNHTKALKRIDLVALRATSQIGEGAQGPIGELKKFEGHTGDVKSVGFSHDGRFAISGGTDQTVRIWNLAQGREHKILQGHEKQVFNVAFHPNDRQVLSASWDKTARLWELHTGQEVRRFTHKSDCNGLAVSKSGNLLATGADDHSVYLWDINNGNETRRLLGHTGFVYTVAISPDASRIASGGVDKSVRLFDANSGNVLKVFDGHAGSINRVAFSSDGRYLASCGDTTAIVWDVAGGREVQRFQTQGSIIYGLAMSADGRRLLTGGEDKLLRVWDVASGKELHRFDGHTQSITSIALSNDGRRCLTGSNDRTVRLWSVPLR